MVGIQTEVAIAWPISLFSSTDTQARTPVSYIYLACRFSLTSIVGRERLATELEKKYLNPAHNE